MTDPAAKGALRRVEELLERDPEEIKHTRREQAGYQYRTTFIEAAGLVMTYEVGHEPLCSVWVLDVDPIFGLGT